MANDKTVSEPVCRADRRGKSASRSQIIILLRTHWQKVTEFMVSLRINVTEEFLTQRTPSINRNLLIVQLQLLRYNLWIILLSGNTSALESEIDTKISEKKVWKLILPGGPQLGPVVMRTGIDVEVTANFSKVSIITMLAPSSDWFVGIDSVDLCNSGKWRESWNVTMLAPYDAGTEDGTTFSIDNNATNPPVNIFEITNNTVGAFNAPKPIASLGEFRFVKTDEAAEPTKQTEPMNPPIPTESSGGKVSFHFAVFTSAALMLALLF